MAEPSFLPEDYIERKTQRRTNIVSMTLFVVVMVIIISAFLVTDRQRVDLARQQREVNAAFEEAAKRLEQLDDLQAKKDEMIRKAQVTAVLVERLPRSLLLAELINNMPATLSLLDLELETKTRRQPRRAKTALDAAKQKKQGAAKNQKVNLKPEAPVTDASLQLIGVAPTDVQVAQYMTALSRSDMFDDVNLAFSEEIHVLDNQVMRKFRIDLKLNQDVDTQKMEPKLVQRKLEKSPNNSNSIKIDASGQLVIPTKRVNNAGVVPAADRPERETLKE